MTMQDIRDPIPLWIMAKLYRSERPVDERILAKTLCKEALVMLDNDNLFTYTLDRLVDAKYIEPLEKPYDKHKNPSGLNLQISRQILTKRYDGYMITTAGVLAFRRQITIPIEKIMAEVDRLSLAAADPKDRNKFKEIIQTLKESTDLSNSLIDLVLKIGSPALIAFVLFAKSMGIDVPW